MQVLPAEGAGPSTPGGSRVVVREGKVRFPFLPLQFESWAHCMAQTKAMHRSLQIAERRARRLGREHPRLPVCPIVPRPSREHGPRPPTAKEEDADLGLLAGDGRHFLTPQRQAWWDRRHFPLGRGNMVEATHAWEEAAFDRQWEVAELEKGA